MKRENLNEVLELKRKIDNLEECIKNIKDTRRIGTYSTNANDHGLRYLSLDTDMYNIFISALTVELEYLFNRLENL